jgi:hypothetical protein
VSRTGSVEPSPTIQGRRADRATDGVSSWVALAAALAAFVVGVRWGTGAAGGSDSSCYLNEARLFSRFTTHIQQPLVLSAPWPRAAWTFTPAGHLPSPSRAGAIVPMCPPGLPIVMAPLRWIHAELIVVPLLGAFAVWLTFVFGRRIAAAPAGAASAVLLACSPIFLYQIVQPMTDVPATVWWLLAAVLAIGEQPRPLAAGLAASMAVLTRPNLLPLAVVIAVYFARLKPSRYEERDEDGLRRSAKALAERNSPSRAEDAFRRSAKASAERSMVIRSAKALAERPVWPFLIGLIPGGVVLALLNWRMYGSPVASGYGSAGDLFQLANVAPNFDRYTRWLWQTHTPILALAAAAPFLVARRAAAWLALARAVATMLLYLPYRVFDDWWYIRFLLPAIPFLILLSVAAVARIAGRADRSAVVLMVMTVILGAWWVRTAIARHAFDLREWERHFIDAGRFARDQLPANAAVVTVKHSGSVHYYAQRPTVAWDTLDPGTLDRALDFLRDHGLVPMLMIDAEEEAAFRAKFAESSLIGRLDWPPVTRVARTVRVYDPADRARYWRR